MHISPTAFIAGTKGGRVTHVGISASERAHCLFIGLASSLTSESSFKATSVQLFVPGEISACGMIGFGFGITHTNPPLGARCIKTLCPSLVQRRTRLLSPVRILYEGYQHSPPTPERVFVYIKLVFR
jgi:hypothetical protein